MRTQEEIQAIMKRRNFTLDRTAICGEKRIFYFTKYDYNDKSHISDGISCACPQEDDSFQFSFVTKNLMLLESGELGNLENDEHFDWWYGKFTEDINLLSYNGRD